MAVIYCTSSRIPQPNNRSGHSFLAPKVETQHSITGTVDDDGFQIFNRHIRDNRFKTWRIYISISIDMTTVAIIVLEFLSINLLVARVSGLPPPRSPPP